MGEDGTADSADLICTTLGLAREQGEMGLRERLSIAVVVAIASDLASVTGDEWEESVFDAK